MLRLDPHQRPRLADRITEACMNGWLGEVQGLQVSLDAARTKLASRTQTNVSGRADLGMPIITSHR